MQVHTLASELVSHSAMHDYVHHKRSKLKGTRCIHVKMTFDYFCRQDFPPGTTSTTTGCRDIDSGPAQTMHGLLTSTTTTTPFETDEAGRHGRALLMFQLRYTGSWTPMRP